MKNIVWSIFTSIFITSISWAQSTKELPATALATFDGKTTSIKEEVKKNKITVLVFWAMWNNPSVNELSILNTKTTVPVYAVSVDAKDKETQVLPFAQSKGWKFKFLFDPNKDFFRGVGGTFPPMIYIVNAEGKVLWEKQGFVEADESIILAKITELQGK